MTTPPHPLATRWSEEIYEGGPPAVPAGPLPVLALAGEGIGPELLAVVVEVLGVVERTGSPAFDVRILEDESIDAVVTSCSEAFPAGGALLAGPKGGRFVYDLRRRLDLFCKISPIVPCAELAAVGPLRPEVRRDLDLMVIRENVFGSYQGRATERATAGEGLVIDHHFAHTERGVLRLLEAAARIAGRRRGELVVVVKQGGLPALSRLWDRCAAEVAEAHGVSYRLLDIDLAAYLMIQQPAEFDVVVTSNLFGDVLTDLGGILLGSRALTFGGNFGSQPGAVYQTNHGAAHDLAGTDRANPAGHLLALAMLVKESFAMTEQAAWIETALRTVWRRGWRTADIAEAGTRTVGTREMGRLVGEALEELAASRSPR